MKKLKIIFKSPMNVQKMHKIYFILPYNLKHFVSIHYLHSVDIMLFVLL